ncbi:uncharacterized protein LOC119435447, partial [Dermacentor silvarum]|uniref:uncharacterized protein LOC119435447 n=1 Tax=Dermacentor silvarum TaxID=543639 RepID=UPI00189B11F1
MSIALGRRVKLVVGFACEVLAYRLRDGARFDHVMQLVNVLHGRNCVLHVLDAGVLGVVVTEVRLLSDSNKTQYVLQGEGATLLCFFVLSPGEDLRRVLWFKDGAEVYVWRKGRRPLARNLFDKRVDLSNRSPSFITILSADMSMQGNYTCRVETDAGVSQNDLFLTVIV